MERAASRSRCDQISSPDRERHGVSAELARPKGLSDGDEAAAELSVGRHDEQRARVTREDRGVEATAAGMATTAAHRARRTAVPGGCGSNVTATSGGGDHYCGLIDCMPSALLCRSREEWQASSFSPGPSGRCRSWQGNVGPGAGVSHRAAAGAWCWASSEPNCWGSARGPSF